MTIWDIKTLPLFEGLNPSQIHSLIRNSQRALYKKSECICRFGENSEKIYIIVKGRVGVISRSGAPLGIFKEKNIFGEIGFVYGLPRSASVISLEDTYVVIIDKWLIDNLSKTDPNIELILMKNALISLKNKLYAASSFIGSLPIGNKKFTALQNHNSERVYVPSNKKNIYTVNA